VKTPSRLSERHAAVDDDEMRYEAALGATEGRSWMSAAVAVVAVAADNDFTHR